MKVTWKCLRCGDKISSDSDTYNVNKRGDSCECDRCAIHFGGTNGDEPFLTDDMELIWSEDDSTN